MIQASLNTEEEPSEEFTDEGQTPSQPGSGAEPGNRRRRTEEVLEAEGAACRPEAPRRSLWPHFPPDFISF